MSEDWERLALKIKEARRALRMSQRDMAEAADIGFSTYQRLESGKPFRTWPPSADKAARFLGWTVGSPRAILAGGDPVMTEGGQTAAAPAPAQQLPARVEHALAEGELVDTDVIELPGGLTLVVIAKAESGRSSEEEQRMAAAIKAWTRAQREIRGIADKA